MTSFLQQAMVLCLLLIQALCISSSFAFTPTQTTASLRSSTTSVRATVADDATSSNVKSQYFDFQGHQCYSEVASPTIQPPLFGTKKPEVLLLHGFGCSTVYWRETCRYLNEAGYTVHSVDLLGQGKSDKPGRADGIEYSTSLWAQMADTYAKENIKSDKIVVVGNSLGSCVALAAATGDFSAASSYIAPRTVGIGMYNCGVGMNSRNVIRDPAFNPFQRALLTILFDALDFVIFGNQAVIKYLLNDVVTKELLQNALTGLYQCASDPEARVDDALVESFYLPAKDSGSVEALNQIYTNDPGKTPMEFHEEYDALSELPIKLIWGDSDAVTPIAGSVGQFYTALAKEEDSNVSLEMVNAGHIPFDEIPECNEYFVQWLDELSENKGASKEDKPFFAWPFGQ
mmetsp:Transcript_27876/g.67819  ORF Transcript_27876/g.67819 Transcript_27876/m.67819 type:complete len:401 (+) Transcript_27876:48-1250(+)|eukprot:CAMPEP_0113620016 /NCGR_PEP_ID=MMETSP0017_2-20120614/10185_1 /TAXON_ID=2856 /ORGANISM="Cylindrotheca closterium" /LENGTH=400 /DNA_ID=CAMNT_0000529643 /DNA_START=49 /DNA_END=1251 /DNA_ORIENTATION=+ /assembly_acc=CAM_ASM_000147